MSLFEAIAVAISLLAIWLTTQRHMLCWPVGLLSVVLYAKIFLDQRLYSDLLLQVLFALSILYGWVVWQRGESAADGGIEIVPIGRLDLGLGLAAGAVGGAALGWVMALYTDAALPWLDSTLTSFSLVAQYWTARRHLANWVLWIVVDCVYVGMFLFKSLYLTAGLYALFIGLAVIGFRSWRKAAVALLLLMVVIPASRADTAAPDLATVVVTGEKVQGGGLIQDQDQPQAISAVADAFIRQQAPTENAFQLVSLLPGANVATSDPYGISTAYSLSLRGLGQDEIGVLLEGAPQNDIGYFYAYPSQFADAENIRQVTLEPGSIDLDSPIINGAGGLLSVTLTDPESSPGGEADLSYGSYNERRGFLRLDSGLIGDTGLRAFVSYSKTDVDNWRGYGRDKKQHVDFKLVYDWGSANRIAVTASYNDAVTSGYPQPTLDDWNVYGRSFNYDHSYTIGDTNYWKFYVNTFRDLYFSLPSSFHLADALALDVTPYIQTGYGNSPYGTQLTTTGNYFGTSLVQQPLDLSGASGGVAEVLGNYTGDQYRAGVVAKLSATLGDHTLIGGFWYDYADDKDLESFSPVAANGDPVDLWGYPESNIRLPDGRIYAVLDDHTVTQIESLFLADRIALLDDKVQIDLGFKAVYVSRDGTNGLPGPQYSVSLNDFQALPRAAISWQVDGSSQIFADVTTNFRSPNEYDLYNSYYDGALVGVGSGAIRDEYSVAEELGYRYRDKTLSAAATFFNYDFANRQIATIVTVTGAQVNATVNGGGQTSRGLDAEIGLTPVDGFSPYVSGEYLDATTTNDIPSNGDYVRTAGKTAIRSPKLQLALGLAYDQGGLFGSLAAKYVGTEYATFDDDEKLADHGELDASLGYRLRRSEIRLNLINLTDEKSLSGIASPTTNAKPATGVYGTPIAGTAPTYYIGTGFAAVLTVSSRF
jgi:iron complex outermembrane receptor protein